MSTQAPRSTPTGDRRKLAVGFVIALVLVYLLGVAVGWEETLAVLADADLGWVVLACGSTLLCLAAWAKTWQVVLGVLDISVPFRRLLVTFTAGAFANYVTPMGQAGGEPFVAYLLSRETAATYEESLASVVIADLLRLLPFFSVAILGVGYLLFSAGLPDPVDEFAVVLVGLAVLVPAVVAGGWRYRRALQRALIRGVAPLATRTEWLSLAEIERRIDEFYDSLELIAGARRALVVAVALSYVGWILFALPLYFSAQALQLPIALLLVCVLVPLTVVAGSTPLPGGLAAIEASLVALLTVLVSISGSQALAITALYRLTSYWIVVLLGGVAALWLFLRT